MFGSRRLAALTVTATVLATPALAQSPAPSAPPRLHSLRHLVFAYTAHFERQNHKTQGDQFDHPSGGTRIENPIYGLNGTRDGTLTVDVVAATGDGGLAVDAAETTGGHTTATARVAITFDQSLAYKARDPFSADVLLLLRFLSRGQLAVANPVANTTWTVQQGVAGGTQTANFTILSVDAARHATVSFTIDTTTGESMNQTVSHEQGTFVYDLALTVPLSVHCEAHRVATMDAQRLTEDDMTDARLVSDSYAAPGPAPKTSAPSGS